MKTKKVNLKKNKCVNKSVFVSKFFKDALLFKDLDGALSLYILEYDSNYSFLADLPDGKLSLHINFIRGIFPNICDHVKYCNYDMFFVERDGYYYVLKYLDSNLEAVSNSTTGDIQFLGGVPKEILYKINNEGKFVTI